MEQHLEAVEAAVRRESPMYRHPGRMRDPIPPILVDVWAAFADLSRTRSSSFNGPGPITYNEMYAWSKLTGQKLEKWQWSCINRLDQVFLQELQEHSEQQEQTPKEM